MRKLVVSLVFAGLCLAPAIAAAQESSAAHTPPKILTVFREFVKPGKAGSLHEKTESAFVQAMRKAKWPTHYLAAESVTGKSRVLFLTGYGSFEAYEKDVMASRKDAALSAALDRAAIADGDLLSGTDQSAWVYNSGHSLRPSVDISTMHYVEITVFHVRHGHQADWEEILKMVLEAYQKIPNMHWAAYDIVYGGPGNTYAFLTAMKSASEIDTNMASDKDFFAAMGADGMKKLRDLSAAAIESSESNLFTFNPGMSYVPDEWIKADPGFWKPKAAAPAKKAMEKPTEAKKP